MTQPNGLRARCWVMCTAGVLLMLEVAGCGEEPVTQASPPAKGAKGKAAPAAPSAPDDGERPPHVEYQEDDFAESERSRDPFRSFEDLFVAKPTRQQGVRPKVVLEDYAVDELRLIGIVSGIRPAKAMVVDPNGVGHIVHQNDLVGRAERVQSTTSAADYEINWRVDRIREGDVVLVREDPANPDVPSATRVLTLRPEPTSP